MSDHSKSSPLPTYFAVWIALLVGTFLTYEVAKIDLGVFNAAVALIIATTKALLVVLFFMHLKGGRALQKPAPAYVQYRAHANSSAADLIAARTRW